jgi:hypothetical protein
MFSYEIIDYVYFCHVKKKNSDSRSSKLDEGKVRKTILNNGNLISKCEEEKIVHRYLMRLCLSSGGVSVHEDTTGQQYPTHAHIISQQGQNAGIPFLYSSYLSIVNDISPTFKDVPPY